MPKSKSQSQSKSKSKPAATDKYELVSGKILELLERGGVRFDYGRFDCYWSHSSEIYTDLDKVLCYLAAINNDIGVSTHDSIKRACDRANQIGRYTDEFESYFFNIKMFKKGTVHLKFKDLELLGIFNAEVARSRKWIGDDSSAPKRRTKPKGTEQAETQATAQATTQATRHIEQKSDQLLLVGS